MTLTEVLKVSPRVRLRSWPSYFYWVYIPGNLNESPVFTVPGTEIRKTSLSVEQGLSEMWEPYTGERNERDGQ